MLAFSGIYSENSEISSFASESTYLRSNLATETRNVLQSRLSGYVASMTVDFDRPVINSHNEETA